MSTTTRGFVPLVQSMVTAIQGRAGVLLDTTVGSVVRALLEAVAAQLLWLQAQFLAVLATTRAATSSGADLDSWMADFALTRLPASSATGYVTVARLTAGSAFLLPASGVMQNGVATGPAAFSTDDGALQFAILPDPTNAQFANGVYAFASNTLTMQVLVGCLTPGVAGNVQAGLINTLASALPGVDTVNNAAALANGVDAESDEAFRLRFQAYMGSLSRATEQAVREAVQGIKNGISCDIVSNQDYATGAARAGYFYVVIDDAAEVEQARAAIAGVVALGVQFDVFGPMRVLADVALAITTRSSTGHAQAVAAVTAALTNYINALPLGAGLPWSVLVSVAYGATSDVANVTGVALAGSTGDIAGSPRQLVRAGAITVS